MNKNHTNYVYKIIVFWAVYEKPKFSLYMNPKNHFQQKLKILSLYNKNSILDEFLKTLVHMQYCQKMNSLYFLNNNYFSKKFDF